MPSYQVERLNAALAGRYAVEREIGRGGMATVYVADDLKHRRKVAVKVLLPELASALGPDRFAREIAIAAGLSHPHIVPLYDSGQADGLLYYVMPYITGESLRQKLQREKQLSIEDALTITRQIASALDYAHSRALIHRDIKPENILLHEGEAMVADFGLALAVTATPGERLTATGLALGTPAYMSPEQVSGEPSLDGRADLYALGCVVHEMLAGEPPFTGPTPHALIAKRMLEPPPRLRTIRETVPEAMERAILRALAKVPADRFGTVGEFARALDEGRRDVSLPAARGATAAGRWMMAALTALLAGGAAVFLLWPHPKTPRIIPSASLIAVLPFTPSGSDSALSRLGRDLVFTLSAALDGLGGIRVVNAHTVLAQARPDGLYSDAEGVALAQRFGAGSVVRGSLVRQGGTVLLDFVLAPIDSTAAPVARASVAGAPDSVAALTDSTVRALLRQVWARGSPPTPSLEGALRTHSGPALRAFLRGEGEMAGGMWDSAAVSYGRARDADPSFWLAYARELFARNWSLAEAEDTVVAALQRHRFELPDYDRLTTEAIVLWSQDSTALSLERARELSERYPTSWFGWLIYADNLFHNGPLLGHGLGEARAGFERALALNPNLIPAHEHLMLLALQDRDSVASGRALRDLARLDAGPILTADGYGNRMLQFRFLDALQRGDRSLVRALTDSIARDAISGDAEGGTFYDAFRYGRFAEQIRVSEQVIRVGPEVLHRADRELLAFSWAARGRWDSALVALDRMAAAGADTTVALRSYGLATVGAWLGAVDPDEAVARRGPALAAAGSDGPARAEVAWLDGLAAAGRRDHQALATARAALSRAGDPDWTALDRSLGAFDAELRGASREAGETMAELEWEEAALGAPAFRRHPYAIAVNRLAAARWLSAAGEHDPAARLLTWVDGAYLLHPATVYGIMLSGLVNLERGRIEERRGHARPARNHYGEFLSRYDLPPAGQRHLIEEAKAAMAR
jgi:TolB-like protein